ncbi:hypothetical protein BDZ45DRAFT_688292 [Acephala macrosclerotiorum]|nr:hypothetical protein BDZ45DRAFT_688292 [Acephala macrosclerotiorum]
MTQTTLATSTSPVLLASSSTTASLPSASACATGLVNGGFESGSVAPWADNGGFSSALSVGYSPSTHVGASDGNYYMESTVNDGSMGIISQTVAVCAGKTYTMQAHAQVASLPAAIGHHHPPGCTVQIRDSVGGKCSRPATIKANAFNTVSKTFKATKTQRYATLQVKIECPNNTAGNVNTVYVDNISIG